MPALAVDSEPPPADEGAALPVSGAEGLEDVSEAFVGKIGNEIQTIVHRIEIEIGSSISIFSNLVGGLVGADTTIFDRNYGDLVRRSVLHPTAEFRVCIIAAIER